MMSSSSSTGLLKSSSFMNFEGLLRVHLMFSSRVIKESSSSLHSHYVSFQTFSNIRSDLTGSVLRLGSSIRSSSKGITSHEGTF